MQALAMENNQAETAFLRREAYGKYAEYDEEAREHESGYQGPDFSPEPDGDTEQVSEAEGAPEADGGLGEVRPGIMG